MCPASFSDHPQPPSQYFSDAFSVCFTKENLCCPISFKNQGNIIEPFNSTSHYLDNLLNINNDYFEQMVDGVYYKENLSIKESNTSDYEAPFLHLKLFNI